MRLFSISSRRRYTSFAVLPLLIGSLLLSGCAHNQRPMFSKFGQFRAKSKELVKKLVPGKKDALAEDEFLQQLADDRAEKVEKSKKELDDADTLKLAAEKLEKKTGAQSSVRSPLFGSSSSDSSTKAEEEKKAGKVFAAFVKGRQKSSEPVKDPFLDHARQNATVQKVAATTDEGKASAHRDLSSALASIEKVEDSSRKLENNFVKGFDESMDKLRADVEGTDSKAGQARTSSLPELNFEEVAEKEEAPSFHQWLNASNDKVSQPEPKLDPKPELKLPERQPLPKSTSVANAQPQLELLPPVGIPATETPAQPSLEVTIPQSRISANSVEQPAVTIPAAKEVQNSLPAVPNGQKGNVIEQKKVNDQPQMIITPAFRATLNASEEMNEMIVDSESLKAGWTKPAISLMAATVTEDAAFPTPLQRLSADYIPIQDSGAVPAEGFLPESSMNAKLSATPNAVGSNSSTLEADEQPVESLAPVEWVEEPVSAANESTPLVPFIMIVATLIAIIMGILFRLRSRFGIE